MNFKRGIQMRYPEPLKKGGTIGFIAPSFGCAVDPYETRFQNALKIFGQKGYKTLLGPNCFADRGIGISNTPESCAAELNAAMTDDRPDVIISCGGGELMCEVVPYIDFEKIRRAAPKWYMGYSDNTNYTFLSAILADTAAIYGPCAPTFGRVPWHPSVEDAFALITGESNSVTGYDLWEKWEEDVSENEAEKEDEPDSRKADPLAPYRVTEKTTYRYFRTGGTGDKAAFNGRLLGGCVDILTLLTGTKYDRVGEFLEKYREDGFIWFLECCDLNVLAIRRAFWQMREAGWFRYAKGFLIGRPLHFGEAFFGVDQYNAVTDIIGSLGVPVIMDLDIGHLPPMMPIICGSLAEVKAESSRIQIDYHFK